MLFYFSGVLPYHSGRKAHEAFSPFTNTSRLRAVLPLRSHSALRARATTARSSSHLIVATVLIAASSSSWLRVSSRVTNASHESGLMSPTLFDGGGVEVCGVCVGFLS